MSIQQRLAKLEGAMRPDFACGGNFPQQAVESDEAIQDRWLASCFAILETMTEEHQSRIIEESQGPLVEWFYELAGDHFSGNFARPLELPPSVGHVLLGNEYKGEKGHECEECGFSVPGGYRIITGGELLNGVKNERTFFRECPLCGGRVGWAAFYVKHGCYPK